ncbi:MAG: hypothetical protein AABY00_03370 [Nanoarchaeota archaeon]
MLRRLQEDSRIVFPSAHQVYFLNPRKIFDVVVDMGQYLIDAKVEERKINGGTKQPQAYFSSKGRTLLIETNTVTMTGTLKKHTLAELVLSSNEKTLTLTTYKHARVAIPSDELHKIGKRY